MFEKNCILIEEDLKEFAENNTPIVRHRSR